MSSSVDFYGVPNHLIAGVWSRVKNLIEPAIKRTKGRFKIEDIKKSLLQSDMQLWVAVKDKNPVMAAITEIVVYPNKKYCRILWVGGSRNSHRQEWKGALLKIEKWAKDLGCSGMETYSRKGGIKAYQWANYKCTDYLLTKEF